MSEAPKEPDAFTLNDYIVETSDQLAGHIATLEAKARLAHHEAEHARAIGPSLDGPARAAEEEARRLESEVERWREVTRRIDQGYQYWVRAGLEDALEALGDPWRWDVISVALSPEMVVGNDHPIRLTVDVQRQYKAAVESRLFRQFEVCTMFETGADDVARTSYYMFGAHGSSDDLFLIASW